jgi:hypothetical protein
MQKAALMRGFFVDHYRRHSGMRPLAQARNP